MKKLLIPFIWVAELVVCAGSIVLGSSGKTAIKLDNLGTWASGKRLGGPNGKDWEK